MGGGRLVRIEVENFKSYGGKQVIGPFKDFTAIIGPNGAGKSNVMDAISFVLGVQSKKLRSQKLSDLVFRSEGNEAATAVASTRRGAMVKLVYAVGPDEVPDMDENEEIHFSRVISATGTSTYRLDGRDVTFDKYDKMLRRIGVLVKAKTFLVFQGDVDGIASKSPMELTTLFEQISASDELKREYDAVKKEQEHAKEMTKLTFKKKQASMVEKREVKEQKEEALEFQNKQETMAQLRRDHYLVQLFHLDRESQGHEKELSLMHEELGEVQEQLREVDSRLKKAKAERAGATRRMNEAEEELADRRNGLDAVRPEGIKEEISQAERQIAELETQVEQMQADGDEQAQSVAELEEAIQEAKDREGKLEAARAAETSKAQMDEAREDEYQRLKAEVRQQTQQLREELDTSNRQLGTNRDKMEDLVSKEADFTKRLSHSQHLIGQYEDRRTTTAKAMKSVAAERTGLEEELEELSSKTREDRTKADAIDKELEEITVKMRDAKDMRRSSKQEDKMAECLEALKRLFPGVRGRLVDLCKPSKRKYNMAVTVAAGKFMDAIVVDTKACGFDCIKYMRDQRIGTATFIPLDDIRPKPLNERLRALGENFRLAADVIACEDDLKPAVMFAVGNTVVADRLQDARDLCFRRKENVKCVSLQGDLISKAGNMTGGTSSKDAGKADRWDEKEYTALTKRRDALQTERGTLSRGHRTQSLLVDLQTQIEGLRNKEQYSRADQDKCGQKLEDLGRQVEKLKDQLHGVKEAKAALEAKMASQEETVSSKQEEMNRTEDDVFADFTASVGVQSIRDFEQGALKDIQSHMKKALKLREHRTKLEAQLEYENSRDFEGPLAKVRSKLASKQKQLPTLGKKFEKLMAKEAKLRAALDEAQKLCHETKEAAKGSASEVKKVQAEKDSIAKEKAAIGKRITTEEAAQEQARARLHEVLQKAQVEEVDLPMLDGAKKKGKGKVKARSKGKAKGGGGKKRRRGEGGATEDEDEDDDDEEEEEEDDDEDEDEEEEEEEEDASETSSMQVGASSETTRDSESQGGGTSTLHFSQTDSKVVRQDRAAAHKVDISKAKHKGVTDPHDREEVLQGYKRQMATLAAEIDRMQPNMKAADRFGEVVSKVKEDGEELQKFRHETEDATTRFNEIRQERYDRFKDCFNRISESLSAIYKELTMSSKHPLGGSAFLDVDNEEEPYLGGIDFHATPPSKRFREISELSGGERTMAALALLFAIHAYRPSPFFVLDEIDSALDNINIRKVCNYVQHRSGDDLQSIVITQRDAFYDKADCLVGICKDIETSCSRNHTFDLTRYNDPEEEGSGEEGEEEEEEEEEG